VVIKTKNLAKNVFLSSGSTLNFSDNYFDMLPNTEKTVTIKKTELDSLDAFKRKLKIVSLIDSYKSKDSLYK
jgi:beta-mannosidase